MATPYHPPVKRSVEIAGHRTSVSLEPLFWDWLRAAAGKGAAHRARGNAHRPAQQRMAHQRAGGAAGDQPGGAAGFAAFLVDPLGMMRARLGR